MIWRISVFIAAIGIVGFTTYGAYQHDKRQNEKFMRCESSEFKPYVCLVQVQAKQIDSKRGEFIVKYPHTTLCEVSEDDFNNTILKFGMSVNDLVKNKRAIFKDKSFWQYNDDDNQYRYFKDGRFVAKISNTDNKQWKVHEYIKPSAKLARVTGKSESFTTLEQAMLFIEGI